MKLQSWAWKPKAVGTVSLCMIMRNEERLLARCLKSVRGDVDEIIIVDTGSTDRSVAIAIENGARVVAAEWQDDFSGPRNMAIEQARKQWVLIMDPDEVIGAKDRGGIKKLTAVPGVIAWRITTRNYTNNEQMQGFVRNDRRYKEGEGWKGWTPSIKTRLFKNGRGLKFKGRWHELIDYDLNLELDKVMIADLPVHHYAGEICQETIEEKKRFYLRLGELKVRDNPDDCQAWWELAVAEMIMGWPKRGARSMIMSMRKGYYTAERMMQLFRALRMAGFPGEARLAYEKALCKQHENLTHHEDGLKTLKPFLPHFDKNF